MIFLCVAINWHLMKYYRHITLVVGSQIDVQEHG